MVNSPLAVVDDFFASLRDRGFIPEEDVAWVGVPLEFLQQLGELKVCPVRHCHYTSVGGVEFRECARKTDDIKLEGWFAWDITARTKKLFKASQDASS